jgi:hypothetical protein
MQKVFFATGGSPFSRYLSGTPSSWYFCTANSTEGTLTEYQQGSWSAVFIYWENPTGTTNQFNAQSFINFVRTQSTNPNIPVFLIVPSQYASQASNWQQTVNATGYVIWNETNPTEFINQVNTTLTRYNVVAA